MPWFNQQGGDPFVPVSCLTSNSPQCQNYLHQCGFQAKLLAFPGHTPGQTALYFPQENYLFAGDFIFTHTTGRTDLPDANAAAMQASLKRLQKLPPHKPEFILDMKIIFSCKLAVYISNKNPPENRGDVLYT